MVKQSENAMIVDTLIEGIIHNPDRLKAYESTSNKILFIVKWNKAEKRHNLCLPVYTVEDELIGFIRKEVEKIKELFTEYSDPVALLIDRTHRYVFIDLYFSHDKEYLEELRKRTYKK